MHIVREKCVLSLLLVVAVAVARPTASQEVTLPLADYESLRQRAQQPSAITLTPAVPIALESATVELDVGDERARFSLELTIVIYDDGWQSIPLPADGRLTAVELGALDGRVSAPPSEAEASARALICRGRGRHVIHLEGVVPVVSDTDSARPSRSVTLELPAAGVVTGLVRSARDGDEIVFVSGAIVRSDDVAGSRRFVGEPGSELELDVVGERQTPSSTIPLVFEASSSALASVSRDRVELDGAIRLDIVQGEMDRLRVSVPAGMEVLDVTSDGEVELGWDIDAESRLDIRWTAPVSGVVTLSLSLTGPGAPDTAEGAVAPFLDSEGAARSLLMSSVAVDGDGIATWTELGSARRASASDKALVPRAREAAAVFVIRDPGRPPRWRVDWAAAAAGSALGAQVDRLIVDALVGESGKVAYQYWAVVRSPGAMSLAVSPPSNYELVAAENEGRRVIAGRSDAGIEVPLTATAEPQVVYLLGLSTLSLPAGKGSFELPLPSFSAPVARVEVRAVVPGERVYELEREGLEGLVPRLPSVATEREEDQGSAPSFLAAPAGYETVLASWSALNAAPHSLAVHSKPKRQKRRWQ